MTADPQVLTVDGRSVAGKTPAAGHWQRPPACPEEAAGPGYQAGPGDGPSSLPLVAHDAPAGPGSVLHHQGPFVLPVVGDLGLVCASECIVP